MRIIPLKTFSLFTLVFSYLPLQAWSWGFFAHKKINRYAITTLPKGMFCFYKKNLVFLTEKSVAPDNRRYVLEGEAEKHFIDLELYDLNLINDPVISLDQAIELYGAQQVIEHGQLPWAIIKVHKQLTKAFMHKNIAQILKLSADLGHYIADAHVPLHTTQNYNGQMTEQEGIHALWETRLPTLFFDKYNLFVGQASYINDPLTHIWKIIRQSHTLVNKVLDLEKQISEQSAAITKYSFEQEGNLTKKQYSFEFSTAYHEALEGQVEERLKESIIQTGNFWLTAWIDAGCPNLDDCTITVSIEDEDDKLMKQAVALKGVRTCND
ncbi:zinc dependent phospholipase C family protein [Cardinium endosymbiont of Culicoides punctatus]|uniref:zinc dependent phospholipase C family protein n=1 Tax=Cardinium endosymbiont of Culicoides punctatus TaxID=2304601 RepID=UPI001058F13E|nr:zinc dependent phospholipase C family protein [Cardinium endosymbiont of Culicoides punctatus]